MGKWIKRILGTIALVAVLLVVAVIALPLIIDPNAFKGPIQNAARDQGIALDLRGPISWQFYPNLGLSLTDVQVAPASQPEQAIANLAKGVAAVQLMPLFSGQVKVREVIIDGAQVNLVVDEQGKGNWELLTSNDSASDTSQPTDVDSSQALDVSMESLRITNTSLSYEDRSSQQKFAVSDLELRLDDVNLNQRPIPVQGNFRITSQEPALTVDMDLKSRVTLGAEFKRIDLAESELKLGFPDHADANVNLNYSATVQLEPTLNYKATVSLAPLNLAAMMTALGQELPPMQNPKALHRVSVSTNVTGTDQQAELSNFQFDLDETRFEGDLAWRQNGDTTAIKAHLKGGVLNVDDYLAPSSDEQAPTTAAATNEDSPLPLDLLRTLDVDLKLTLERLTAQNMPVINPSLAVLAQAGRWQLQSLSGEFYQGKLDAAGELDASKPGPAPLQFAAKLNGLAVQPLLQDLAEFGDVAGTINGDLTATSRAETVNQLLERLNANFVFNSQELTLQGMNVEQYYCQMAAYLNEKEQGSETWPQQTAITNVQGKLVFAESKLNIDALRANLGNLVVQGKGFADLNADNYRVRLPLLLSGERTSETGCRIDSEFLLSHEVDIVGCQGSLENLALGEQCGLDREAVTTLAKQAVRYNAQKKIDPKKEELRNELKEKLEEKLGKDDAGSARDLLKNLLKRD